MTTLITVPRTSRPSARSFRLGIDKIDAQALEGRAIEPASLTLIAGHAMSGCTTAAANVVHDALCDLDGTHQKVVFITADPNELRAISHLDTAKHANNLRYAAAQSLTDVVSVLTQVFAQAHTEAQAAGSQWEEHAPVLLVIDDACTLMTIPYGWSASQTYRGLMDLSADLASGAFSLDLEQLVGSQEDRLLAYSHARTRSGFGLPVATVMTVRSRGTAGTVTVADLPHDFASRAHLIVNPGYSRVTRSTNPAVLKNRSGRLAV